MKPLGDGLLDHAIRLLDHEDPDLRIQAVLLLERFASPKTAAAVLKLLGDPDWWVRIMACDALGRLKDPRTLPYLERLLDDPDCKWAAIDSIGAIGGDAALGALVKLLGDPQNEVRLVAMNALGKVPDKRVDPYIEQLSKTDPSLDLRVRAVELLRERRGTLRGCGGRRLQRAAHPPDGASLRVRPRVERLGPPRHPRRAAVPPHQRRHRARRDEAPLARARSSRSSTRSSTRCAGRSSTREGAVDFCYAIPGVGRYRVNVFRQIRGTSAVVRVIPNVTPTLTGLRAPEGPRGDRHVPPGHHPPHGPRRRRQVEHADGARERAERVAQHARPHARGPDRVPPLAEEGAREPARDWARLEELRRGDARGAARGPGRHRRRRAPRQGDHAPRDDRGRDGPPRHRDDADDRRHGDRRQARRELPGRRADRRSACSSRGSLKLIVSQILVPRANGSRARRRRSRS